MSARLRIPNNCPHCHARDAVVIPSGWWRVAAVAGWVTMAAMVLGLGMTGIMGLGLVLPGVVLYGLGALPFLHGRASEPATCDTCGKIVEPRAEPAAGLGRIVAAEASASMPLRHGA